MGHVLLPTLPNTIQWKAVVEALGAGAPVEEIVALSTQAVEKQLRNAASDPVYREAIRLLTLTPLAARRADMGAALRELGLGVGDAPDLTDIVFSAGDRLDRIAAWKGQRDDFGELSRRALSSAISACIGRELPGLIEAMPADVAQALRRLSQPREFTRLARAFYTKLLSETLSSFLDWTLADPCGPRPALRRHG